MTCLEFNTKWNAYLVDGYYGVAIENKKVLAFLDAEFQKEIESNSGFNYKQVKVKFDACRVYANSKKVGSWEEEIDALLGSL